MYKRTLYFGSEWYVARLNMENEQAVYAGETHRIERSYIPHLGRCMGATAGDRLENERPSHSTDATHAVPERRAPVPPPFKNKQLSRLFHGGGTTGSSGDCSV